MNAGPVQIQQQQQAAAAAAAELAKRRSTRPTDKNLPDGVERCIVDSEVAKRYKDLRDIERRLDTTMTRKRLDVMDTANRNSKVRRASSVHLPNPYLLTLVFSSTKPCGYGYPTLSKIKSGRAPTT